MRKTIKPILVSLILYLLFAIFANAQANITILEQSIESKFRDHITMTIAAESVAEITEVEFFYRLVGERASQREQIEIESGTNIEAEYRINQQSTYFPPGTELEYWWKLTDTAGNSLKTEPEIYLYLDNRHDFQTLSNERLTLYWYKGGDNFGKALFEQANKGLDQLENDVGATIDRPIKIFIYGSHDDLLDAIAVGAQEWTGGQAFSDRGVVVIGINVSSLTWGLGAMTHELTHLVIHQATDNPYGDLPRWLDEGLAVYNEDPTKLDSDFRGSFQAAVDSNNLMTLQTLSSSFPADPDEANLAYGESGAVVKFMIDTYGPEAMKHLLDIFSEGALYDDALEEALGVNMRELNNLWLESLGLPPLDDIVPTAAQPETESPESATQPPPTPAPLATNTQAVAENLEQNPSEQTNSSTTQNTTDSEATDNSRNSGCLFGLLPLFLVGLVFNSRWKIICSH